MAFNGRYRNGTTADGTILWAFGFRLQTPVRCVAPRVATCTRRLGGQEPSGVSFDGAAELVNAMQWTTVQGHKGENLTTNHDVPGAAQLMQVRGDTWRGDQRWHRIALAGQAVGCLVLQELRTGRLGIPGGLGSKLVPHGFFHRTIKASHTQSYGREIARGRGPLICWIGLSRRQNWAVDGPCSKQLSQVPGGSQRRLWRHTSSLAWGSSAVSASARPRVGAPARCFAMRCTRSTLLLACTARCQPVQSSSPKLLRSGAVFCLLAPCSSAPSLFHGLHSFLPTTIIVHAPFVLATRHFGLSSRSILDLCFVGWATIRPLSAFHTLACRASSSLRLRGPCLKHSTFPSFQQAPHSTTTVSSLLCLAKEHPPDRFDSFRAVQALLHRACLSRRTHNPHAALQPSISLYTTSLQSLSGLDVEQPPKRSI